MALDVLRLAAELRRAESAATPTELFSQRFPSLKWHDARAIALARDLLRTIDGDTRIGYKLGWTSAAMREALGIERPNWGTLWQSQLLTSDLDITRLIHPKLEPELVYRCTEDLAGELAADTIAASGLWALGLEVVDPRWPSFAFDFLDNTADNSSGARVAVGDFVPIAKPSQVTVEFTDGSTLRHGQGANALGDPLLAVAWLVRSLAAEGSSLRAGDIVFTGGLTAPFDVEREATYTLTSPDLGALSLQSAH